MKRTVLLATTVGIFIAACARDTPTAPSARGMLTTPMGLADSAGIQKMSIRGSVQLVSVEPPDRRIVTPSGTIHAWEVAEHTLLTGDVSGAVTFHASNNSDADRTHRVFRGPFEGEVTFQGRTGLISGEWTTNCNWDDALRGLSCAGRVMNARGEGGLEGVQFHFELATGWWPFAYSGTAFVQE